MQPLAIAIMFGLALALLSWSVYYIVVAVPSEDRTYLDQPPLGFRLLWPLVQFVVYYLGPKLSMAYRLRTHARLKRAGVDYSISSEQFFAGKVLSALGFAALTALMLKGAEFSAPGLPILAAVLGFFYPDLWIKELIQRRLKNIEKGVPFYLDIITLAVEAGSNLTGAFNQAVEKSPEGPLKFEINRVLRDIRSGKLRTDALRAMAERINVPSMTNLVNTLVQAETMGTSLGPVLRAQSNQRRTERFQRAEKLATEAPVKLLAPLIMFIFPNTFIVLGFPIAMKFLQQGIL